MFAYPEAWEMYGFRWSGEQEGDTKVLNLPFGILALQTPSSWLLFSIFQDVCKGRNLPNPAAVRFTTLVQPAETGLFLLIWEDRWTSPQESEGLPPSVHCTETLQNRLVSSVKGGMGEREREIEPVFLRPCLPETHPLGAFPHFPLSFV